jgi:hypothetical protein
MTNVWQFAAARSELLLQTPDGKRNETEGSSVATEAEQGLTVDRWHFTKKIHQGLKFSE